MEERVGSTPRKLGGRMFQVVGLANVKALITFMLDLPQEHYPGPRMQGNKGKIDVLS